MLTRHTLIDVHQVEAAGNEAVDTLLVEPDKRCIPTKKTTSEDGVCVELELGQLGAAGEQRINPLARARAKRAWRGGRVWTAASARE